MRFLPLLIASLPLLSLAADKSVLPTDKSADSTELIRTLHEGINFKPYTDKAAWQKRATYLREQVLISAGLWPMPEKCPLNAVIHGRIDRDDYTIEKVYFESYPGFYVTGNLYRPKGKVGPLPAVLSPHGHWENGRLYEAPDSEVKRQLADGLEKDPDAARYPLQARCANLARLGCIVFFYDMIGFADADPEHFLHHNTYRDLDSDLHGLSIFGLQTWNSIRSLDFLESLPDVDKTRIAITGASGGGTQSFMMMAIDDRLACAAPVNMISAGEHQGGCVCENNSLLRLGTDNVELAATFAPKPFIHPTATGDWTKDYLEKGFPEIQATYKLFAAEANVETMRQTAPHNYNVHAREAVYNFFNKHLKLGHEGVITEAKFTPVKPADLHVWDAEHPWPKNAVDPAGLKKWWVEMTRRQIDALKPTDRASAKKADQILRPVLIHLLGGRNLEDVVIENKAESMPSPVAFRRTRFLSRKGQSRIVTVLNLAPSSATAVNFNLVLTLPGGIKSALNPDGTPIDSISALVKNGHHVIVPDLFGDGASGLSPASAQTDVEFFAGYNLSTLARQVQDLVMVLDANGRSDLVGIGKTATICLLARAMAPDRVWKTKVDGSLVDKLLSERETDPTFLPHSLRYGGVWPLAALGYGDVNEIYLSNTQSAPPWLKSMHDAMFDPAKNAYTLHLMEAELTP